MAVFSVFLYKLSNMLLLHVFGALKEIEDYASVKNCSYSWNPVKEVLRSHILYLLGLDPKYYISSSNVPLRVNLCCNWSCLYPEKKVLQAKWRKASASGKLVDTSKNTTNKKDISTSTDDLG